MTVPSPRIAAFAAALSEARRQRAAAAFAALERAHNGCPAGEADAASGAPGAR